MTEEQFRNQAEAGVTAEGTVLIEDGKVIDGNGRFAEMFGYRLHEVIGMSASDLVAEEDREKLLRRLRSANLEPCNALGAKRDGVLFPVEIWFRLIPYYGRRALMVSFADLARRERTESEARYRALTEATTDAILTIDEKSTISFANAAARHMFGYTEQEMLGSKLTMLMPERLRSAHEADFERYLKTSEPRQDWKSRITGLDKHGDEIPLEVSFGEYATNGRRFFVGLMREVTERVRADETFKESEELARRRLAELQSVYASIPVGLAFVDTDLRFVNINEELAQINGLLAADHVGKALREVLPTELASEVEALHRSVIETDEPVMDVELEGDTRARPGETRVWLANYHPVKDAKGKMLGVNAVVQDITERKRGERAGRVLADASSILASTLDYRARLKRLAHLAVPELADWCSVDILAEDGSLENIEVAHKDPEKVAPARRLQERYPPDPDSPHGAAQVIRSGWPELVSEVPGSMLDRGARDEEHRELLRELSSKSYMVVPLIARGRTLGAITLVSAESGRRYEEEDLRVAEAIAHRVALAVDNARLYEEARREIAERARTEEALRDTEQKYRSIVENAVEGICQSSLDGRWLMVNPAMARIFGYDSPEELVSEVQDLRRLWVEPEAWDEFASLMDERGAVSGFETRAYHRSGAIIWLSVNMRALRDEDGEITGFERIVEDVTERKALGELLEHQALHDSLTGLPNRTLLIDRLRHALARTDRHGAKVATLYVDLDDFKRVNDCFGHDAGDQLLIEVVRRIQSCTRSEDTIARLGGDEFVVVLEDLGEANEAIRAAERIIEALRHPVLFESSEAFAEASIGISIGASGEDSPESLLRDADIAMYRAKEDGKDHYEVFDPEMTARSVRRLWLERDLRKALADPAQEFQVHYQTESLIQIGEIVGAEALLRWQHPEHGLISPAEFIPLAEETGMIVELGGWALGEACRQAARWHASRADNEGEAPPFVSVNLSARQLRFPGMIQEVSEILEETGLEAESLTLEITETAAIRDVSTALDVLGALKRLV